MEIRSLLTYIVITDIYSNKIVWDGWGIFLYDLSTNKVTKIVEDGEENGGSLWRSNENPVIYGNNIVRYVHESGDVDSFYSISLYDLSNKKETTIASTMNNFLSFPDIYNDKIVYAISGYGYAGIYMSNISTQKETQINSSEGAGYPRVYGNRIVWTDHRNGNWDIYNIYMYDLSTNTETQITTSGAVSNPDIYDGKIVWQDGRNGKSDIYMATLTVIADFSASPTSGKAPLKVQFDDKSTGVPTKWKWSFGDGKTSTQQNPKHQYLQEGKYKVTLTVTNAAGSNTTTKTNYIKVTTNTRPGIYSESE